MIYVARSWKTAVAPILAESWIRPCKVIVLKFARVVFGVSSSPFLLNATIKHHVEKYTSLYPELVRDLLRSIYIDDIVFGADDEESAFDLYVKSKGIATQEWFI